MKHIQIPYPPCVENPVTERPYYRHKPKIVQGQLKADRRGILHYHVVCSRCGFIDKSPPSY